MRLYRSKSRTARRRPLLSGDPAPRQPSMPSVEPPRAPVATRESTGHSWLQRSGLVIVSLAILASAVNALTLSPDVKIVPLSVAGKDSLLRPAADYQAAADRELSSSVWSRNKVTVNTAGLSSYLLSRFPELSSASVTLPLVAHRPIVYLASAQPVLILVTNDGSFVIDSTGKAVIGAPNPSALNRADLPQLTDQSGLRIQSAHQALPATSVGFIQVVMAQLAAKQFKVSGMTLPPAASELDVHLRGQPYFIKFNLENDQPREQAGAFLATANLLRHQNITPSQYIDVRVPGRAYYK